MSERYCTECGFYTGKECFCEIEEGRRGINARIQKLEARVDELEEAVKKCLTDNAHLADGEVYM